MTKCYGHEECEFNAQPNCALPNGMECPHRVKADKPAAESKTDIEALIERLNQYSQSMIAYQMGGEFSDVCVDAATALSTLQAENEKLRAELEQVKQERDAAQRLLAEHTGVVGMEKVTTCAEKKAWLRRYQGSLRQEKELAEEVEQLEVEI